MQLQVEKVRESSGTAELDTSLQDEVFWINCNLSFYAGREKLEPVGSRYIYSLLYSCDNPTRMDS